MHPLELCPEPHHSVVVRPNRSASPRQLTAVVAALAVVCAVVCGLSFLQGNLWAPLFGVLDVMVVGGCLRAVWRAADQSDTVVWSGADIEVHLRRGSRHWRYRFHPYWVRLERETCGAAGGDERVTIGSHGRKVELGRFLCATRRAAMAKDVARLLEAARAA